MQKNKLIFVVWTRNVCLYVISVFWMRASSKYLNFHCCLLIFQIPWPALREMIFVYWYIQFKNILVSVSNTRKHLKTRTNKKFIYSPKVNISLLNTISFQYETVYYFRFTCEQIKISNVHILAIDYSRFYLHAWRNSVRQIHCRTS